MNKKLFSVFFLMLFLNSSFAYSLPLNSVSNESVPSGLDEIPSHPLQGLGDDEFNAVVIRLQETPLQDKPVDAKDSEIVPLACTLTSLTDSEVQKIKDDIRIPGIIVGDISTGVKSKDLESLDRTQAILTEQGSDVGSLVTIPSVKVTPGQYPFLNHAGKGAFSVGVLLDDTLRVAKCPDDVILAGKCAIDDKLLSLRNSGSGIKSNFVTASKSFFNEMIASKVAGNSLTPAQGASFNENYETSTVDGKEPLQIKQVTREAGNAIKNRIHSSDFTALMEANAPQGTISIYSMFDKYFNSIFSAEAVSSIAGPTLLNQAKNLMGKAHLRLGHYWPFELKNKTVFRNLEAKFSSPDSFLGTRRVEKIRLLKTKHPEIGDLHFDMVLGKGGSSGYALIKGGTFQDWLNRNMGKEGLIGKIKDPELKHEILEYAELVEGHMRTVQTIANQATQHADGVRSVTRKALEASEITQEEATRRINQATIEEAQSISKVMQTVDDTMDLDLPEYFMRKQEYGFPGKGIYNTKLKHHQDLYEDSTNYDTGLFKSFQSSDGGRWTPENTVYQTDGVGNIVLYEMSPTGKEIGRIGKGDLEFVIAEGKYREKMTQLQDGTYVLINENNKGVISSQAKSPLSVFDVGWKETGKLTPTDLANKLTEPYVYKRLTNYAPFNAKQLVNTLIEHNFASRKYTSILDKQFAQEAKLLTEYWTLKGGAKFTALPVVYWWSRKGFGIEDISFYQLPLESWTQVIMKTGEEDIYKAAYVDFFANEGSDQGDLFAQVIQKLPWKQIYDKTVSTLFDPIQDTYDYFTGVQRRDTVQNLVFFLTGGKECSTCQYAFSSADNKSLTTTFNSTQKMDSFLFEETKASEDQLLIAFAHATDLVGNPNNNEKTGQEEPIILSAKDTKAKSCREKAKSISLGFDTGTTVGGYYALAENLGYYFFGWPAIIGTFANQLFFLPELHGCIDDQEGYFVHYYIAKPKEGKKQTATEIAASKTANAVQVFKDQFLGLVTGETDSFVDTQAKKVESKIADFVKSNSQAKDVVQAELHFAGFASGKTTATDFFYVWFEGGSDLTKTKYLEEGKMVLKGQTAQDAEGNRKDAEMVLDNKTGELTVNGKKIIDSEDSKDNVRLASTNTAIPAIEIPNRLGKIGLKDSGELFEINLLGSSKVLDDDVLDCIQKAVVDQTGVELNSSDIADAFGPAGLIVTDTYPQLLLVPGEKKLIAEGLTRKTFIGSDVLVKIANSRDVNVISPSINESFYTGKFESLQLENGEILYKASTNELIIWLKRHKDTILSNRDVLNLKATPSSVLNPENDCTENALDLSIIGQPTEAGKQKEDNFNKALQTMGPFQIFDTTDKTFIFYSERDKDGECQNRFKVIDKLTGQIYDQAIKNFEKTADGIRILTADGKEHLINFSAPNGVPTITYNGQDSTLTSAQGRNGAFWYDPEKGMWFADNAQLLPLLEAFKQAGIEFKGNKDGTASAVPGTNIFIGDRVANADNPLANLPSLPENALMFALFLLSIVAVIGTIYLTDKKKKTKKKK